MKPFHFYEARQFPSLTSTKPTVKSQIQTTLFGNYEQISTEITLVKSCLEGNLNKLRVKSGIIRKTRGYFWKMVNKKLQRIGFEEFIEPVKFTAYHDESRRSICLQAPRGVSRGLIKNLEGKNTGIELVEMEVDFAKAYEICPRYSAVWFKDVSSYIRSAGLSGNQLQNDSLFKSMARIGQLSNVVIQWTFLNEEHPVMLTGSSGIVLVLNYGENPMLELRLVWDLYDRLLSKVWSEKKKGKDKTKGKSILEPPM